MRDLASARVLIGSGHIANALFFLRARGIPETEARAMLVEAFLGEALDTIENEGLRQLASTRAHLWLARHAGEATHVE